MFDTSRIDIRMPIVPGPAEIGHYTQPDDLAFLEWWIRDLRVRGRVPASVRYAEISPSITGPQTKPLVVTDRTGHSERGEILRLGQSLILFGGRFTVRDTDTLQEGLLVLGDPFSGALYPAVSSGHPLTHAGW